MASIEVEIVRAGGQCTLCKTYRDMGHDALASLDALGSQQEVG